MKYPEHEKLKLVKDESQKIGAFLEWLQNRGWGIARYHDGNEELGFAGIGIEGTLALYFDIDLKKLDDEKRAMLEELHRLNESDKKWEEILEEGMPGGLRGELGRWLNWRHESAEICWLCGSTNTVVIDHSTRECKDCGNHYAVFPESSETSPEPKET